MPAVQVSRSSSEAGELIMMKSWHLAVEISMITAYMEEEMVRQEAWDNGEYV